MLAPIQNLLLYGLVPLLIALAAIGAALLYLSTRRRHPPQQPTDEPASGFGEADADLVTTLPAAPVAPSAPADARPLVADLLLVDDSAVARAKLRRLFEPGGYRVQLARDGVEALELLDKGRYRLMITDLEMPRLDGVALIGECQRRSTTAAMPILAITGHDDLQNRLDECHEICGIYRKPWIDEDLVSHVASLVSRPGLRAADALTS